VTIEKGTAMQIQARPESVDVDPTRTAVLVVDMQNAFGSPGGMFDKVGVPISSIQAAVAPTQAAVEAARRAGLKIVYLKMGFQPDLSDLGTNGGPHEHFLVHMGVNDGVLTRDEWATDILDELTPADDDTVLYKTRFSGFYQTELDEVLRDAGITHLIVTGCTTSICVESTVRDAFFRDYHCVVLEDCTAEPMGAGLSRSNHDATILLVERIFGSVSTSTDFIDALHGADAVRRSS
jgi:ureidoacrylate peracid hydrolase